MYFVQRVRCHLSNDDYMCLYNFICDNFGSLRKFAKYLGYSVAYVSAFINGKKAFPYKIVDKIKRDFGIYVFAYERVVSNE